MITQESLCQELLSLTFSTARGVEWDRVGNNTLQNNFTTITGFQCYVIAIMRLLPITPIIGIWSQCPYMLLRCHNRRSRVFNIMATLRSSIGDTEGLDDTAVMTPASTVLKIKITAKLNPVNPRMRLWHVILSGGKWPRIFTQVYTLVFPFYQTYFYNYSYFMRPDVKKKYIVQH